MACLLLNDDYYLDQSAENHEAAYRCFENLAAEDAKSPLVYSELAALHLEAVTDHYAYPAGATNEQAMSMAHRAVQMGRDQPLCAPRLWVSEFARRQSGGIDPLDAQGL